MEFEDVSQGMEWEAQRVAVAFGVEKFTKSKERQHKPGKSCVYWGMLGEIRVTWGISKHSRTLEVIQLRKLALGQFPSNEIDYLVWADDWKLHRKAYFGEILSCSLYRLGFEDNAVMHQLPPLSAHEKLELRLSLPREFWPKKWLDEESS